MAVRRSPGFWEAAWNTASRLSGRAIPLFAGLAVTDAGWAVIKKRAPAPVAAMRPRRMALAAALRECWLRARSFLLAVGQPDYAWTGGR